MAQPSPSRTPVVGAPTDATRRWFLGSQTWVRVRTADSGGAEAIVEQLIPPGAESPWHVHHTQDETLYVLEGSVTVLIGDDQWTLDPGGCAFMPRSIPHGFRIEGAGRARILLICTPGEGFDRFVEQAGEPAATPGSPEPPPPDILRLSRLAAEHEMEVLGPLPV